MGQGKPATQQPNGLEISTNGSRNESNRTVAIGRKASNDDSRNPDTWQHLSPRKTLITSSSFFSFSYLLTRTTTHKGLATLVLLLAS
ncbi:LOW QUALITY PROTEIN: hypothetical protein TorRG33x02_202490 [Trema orientale]|uniref:Uncharacterized protein n=1 Tax=Trema orientale TaxID=63057 RepID=A0A2P5EEJ1_TREOI|nr:LOW QUALITY PROTEIN: hypothetical protein TorRG33x02_202490 [Trema orientale]